MRMTVLIALLGLSTAAQAKELTVSGGQPTTIRVRGISARSLKLPAGVGGWYLTLEVPGDGARCAAELRDVSPLPGMLPKWVESVPNVGASSTITLDPQRYVGTHTYQMTLRCGVRELSRAFVHLLPAADVKLQQKLELQARPGND